MENHEIRKRVKKVMRKRNPLTGSILQSHECQVVINAACAPPVIEG